MFKEGLSNGYQFAVIVEAQNSPVCIVAFDESQGEVFDGYLGFCCAEHLVGAWLVLEQVKNAVEVELNSMGFDFDLMRFEPKKLDDDLPF